MFWRGGFHDSGCYLYKIGASSKKACDLLCCGSAEVLGVWVVLASSVFSDGSFVDGKAHSRRGESQSPRPPPLRPRVRCSAMGVESLLRAARRACACVCVLACFWMLLLRFVWRTVLSISCWPRVDREPYYLVLAGSPLKHGHRHAGGYTCSSLQCGGSGL